MSEQEKKKPVYTLRYLEGEEFKDITNLFRNENVFDDGTKRVSFGGKSLRGDRFYMDENTKPATEGKQRAAYYLKVKPDGENEAILLTGLFEKRAKNGSKFYSGTHEDDEGKKTPYFVMGYIEKKREAAQPQATKPAGRKYGGPK